MTSQPDKRYFFSVADRTEPSSGQGFQYDRFVRLILYEAGSVNTTLSAQINEQITSASFARAAGSEIARIVSSGFASSFGGTDALTFVRAVAGKASTNHSRFFHSIFLKLGAFPIRRRRQCPCFLLSPLPRLSPSLFLFLVQFLSPDPNGGDAQIPIELLDRVKKGLIVVGRQQYVRRILGVEGEAFGDSDRSGHVAETPAQAKVTQKSHKKTKVT